ncbi:MAG: hypothetical protein ABSC94_16035 [Polyangiaceae bacterium]|jgi:hypothetical protein
MKGNGKPRDELAREANLVRAKLFHTVQELDRRRHDLFDLRRQVRLHLRQVVFASALVAVLTAGAASLTIHRLARAERAGRRSSRVRLFRRTWTYPERDLRAERRPSFFVEIGRALLVSLMTRALARSLRPLGRDRSRSLGRVPDR